MDESERSHGLTKGKDIVSYLSFASLLGVADVLESIVHHRHFNHLDFGVLQNISKQSKVSNRFQVIQKCEYVCQTVWN